jgi:hypothetical protein
MHQPSLRSAALEYFSLQTAGSNKSFLTRSFFKKNIFIDLQSLLPETLILPAGAFLFLVEFRPERSRSDRGLKPIGDLTRASCDWQRNDEPRDRTKQIEDCLADAETDTCITEKDPLP